MPRLRAAPADQRTGSLTVIVPARNESANIRNCLRSLLAQTLAPERLRILVVDDGSSDGTGALAETMAVPDHRLAVCTAEPLPSGAVGKPHACAAGAAMVARGVEWLCFIDADVELAPTALASAIAHAEAGDIDMLCVMPRPRLTNFAERLIIPCGLYALAFTGHVEQSNQPGRIAATGQFMLVRHSAYDAVGGHQAVIRSVVEDFALAQVFDGAGYKVELVDGAALASVRMYADLPSLWRGFSKNLVELFGGAAVTLAIAGAALLLAWMSVLLPPALLLDGGGSTIGALALGVAGLTTMAVLGFHIAGAIYLRIPIWYSLLFPLGYTVGALIALDSVRQRLQGGARWKGRTYP